MKRTTLVTGSLLVSLLLAACSVAGQGDPAQAAQNAGNTTVSGGNTRKLPQAMKLALGTFKLEKTNYPLDPAEAAQLLFLWKGMRHLSQDQTVANEEVQGLIKQIQDTMKPEQIDAINGMNLSFQDIDLTGKEFGVDLGSFGGQSGNLSPDARATFQAARQSGQNPGGFGGGIPGAGGVETGSRAASYRAQAVRQSHPRIHRAAHRRVARAVHSRSWVSARP